MKNAIGKTLYLPRNNEGLINHYHHFLMGYFLPVLNDVPISSIKNTYFVDCGPMNTIIKEFGFLLTDEISTKNFNETRQIKGLDGPEKIIPLDFIENINSKIDQVLNIPREYKDPYILLIDRGSKVDGQHPRNPLGGAYRRTILNMEEVEISLSKFGIVKRCVLENISFKDQVQLFRNASCIVAQHGAGLSSMCFALKCKNLIEIVNTHKRVAKWFQNLADAMKIRRHVIVDPKAGNTGCMTNTKVDMNSLNRYMKVITNS